MAGYRVVRPFDPWRRGSLCTCPFKYTTNPYTGCSHRCIYCYITSYIRDAFNPRPKKDFLRQAIRDLKQIPKGSIINISSSSDPYQPLERKYLLTRRFLEIAGKDYILEVVTKSDLVTRDADILADSRSTVSITITTPDENLARMIEPNAPPPERRIKAIEELSGKDIPVTLRLDPIMPFLTDDVESIKKVIAEASWAGAKHVVTSIYKAKPDNLKRVLRVFPDLADRYRELYFKRGSRIHGYWYADYEYRMRILKIVRRIAHEHGLTFATCREGAAFLHDRDVNCDGTHLAVNRSPLKPR